MTESFAEIVLSYSFYVLIAVITVLFFATMRTFCYCRSLLDGRTIRRSIERRQTQREAEFRQLADELDVDGASCKHEAVLAMNFQELWDSLQAERLSASQVVLAYRWKALQCQSSFNCVIEFIHEATAMARDLDERFHGHQKPALFGLPFSVKENFHMKGYDCTLGLGKAVGRPMAEDCALVAHLKSLGAVPIVRTNVPQTLLSYACSNPIFGPTSNPHRTDRSPGGSSGGEACLVATGGCAFGIGSDLAGSLRIPAHFSGVTCLKCTYERLHVTGAEAGIPGVGKIWHGYGFFAKDVSTLIRLYEAVLQPAYFEREPLSVPLPFRAYQADHREELRIGFCSSDEWFPPVPAIQRAVVSAVAVLENVPHVRLVPFAIPDVGHVFQLAMKCLMLDNGKWWLHTLRHEPVEPALKTLKTVLSLPTPVRSFLTSVVACFDVRAATTLRAGMSDVSDVRGTYEAVSRYKTSFVEAWKESGIHALLCPPFPFPAIASEYSSLLSSATCYTVLFNLLNFPAGIVPLTETTDQDEGNMKTYPSNLVTDYVVQKAMKRSAGLPLSVQVVTLPYHEELCLYVMKMIQDKL